MKQKPHELSYRSNNNSAFIFFSVENHVLSALKKCKRVKYSKAARERIRRRRQLLQEELDREGLKFIATFKDVTKCPSFKKRLMLNKPKITASEIIHKMLELN